MINQIAKFQGFWWTLVQFCPIPQRITPIWAKNETQKEHRFSFDGYFGRARVTVPKVWLLFPSYYCCHAKKCNFKWNLHSGDPWAKGTIKHIRNSLKRNMTTLMSQGHFDPSPPVHEVPIQVYVIYTPHMFLSGLIRSATSGLILRWLFIGLSAPL
jgi:hypothetical protein